VRMCVCVCVCVCVSVRTYSNAMAALCVPVVLSIITTDVSPRARKVTRSDLVTRRAFRSGYFLSFTASGARLCARNSLARCWIESCTAYALLSPLLSFSLHVTQNWDTGSDSTWKYYKDFKADTSESLSTHLGTSMTLYIMISTCHKDEIKRFSQIRR